MTIRSHLFEALRRRAEVGEIEDSMKLVEDLGIGSLQAALILIEVAQVARMSLSDLDAHAIETVADLLACLEGTGTP